MGRSTLGGTSPEGQSDIRTIVRRVDEVDRETRRELDRLLRGFDEALVDVHAADDDEHALRAWRQVQMLGHELNALLPAVELHTFKEVL